MLKQTFWISPKQSRLRIARPVTAGLRGQLVISGQLERQQPHSHEWATLNIFTRVAQQ